MFIILEARRTVSGQVELLKNAVRRVGELVVGKKTVADMFRTAAAINDTAVLARAYMGYVESVRRVEPRLLAEIDIFACRGRVGGVDVVFKSVDGRCKISSVGAAVEELVDRSFGR